MSAGGRRLVVFCRAPAIGVGSRRLARDLGDVAAWRIYRAASARLLRSVRDSRWETVLAVAPDAGVGRAAPGVWPPDLARRGQGPGDLGDRIERALRRPGETWGPTVVVGSDAPDVGAPDIAAAFAALRRAAAVFGPAADGGFWLVGIARPAPPGLWDGVTWSAPDTLIAAEAAWARRGGGPAARLRTLADIDTGADWRARGGRV